MRAVFFQLFSIDSVLVFTFEFDPRICHFQLFSIDSDEAAVAVPVNRRIVFQLFSIDSRRDTQQLPGRVPRLSILFDRFGQSRGCRCRDANRAFQLFSIDSLCYVVYVFGRVVDECSFNSFR